MESREGYKEEGAVWRGNGEAGPAEMREGWGERRKCDGRESRATSKGPDLESPRANIKEDRFRL